MSSHLHKYCCKLLEVQLKLSNMKLLILFFMVSAAFFSGCQESAREEAPRPNILFAIADDATWKHFGAYGCDWVETPAFDRVAENGILFTRAYTPNAKCAPSRSCIMTGRNSWQLEEAANHSPNFPAKPLASMVTGLAVLQKAGHPVTLEKLMGKEGNSQVPNSMSLTPNRRQNI